MKEKLVLALVIALMILSAGVGVWHHYYPLDAPFYRDSDGTTLWKYQMSLEEGKSSRPYLTRYNVFWNGISILVDNQVVAENKWIDFVLWNREGVKDIKVYALSQNGQQLIYPTEKDVSDTASPGWSIRVTREQIEEDDKYIIFGVKPPVTATHLRITVTDNKGNITKDVISVTSIRN